MDGSCVNIFESLTRKTQQMILLMEGGNVFTSVSLSVCLSARSLKKLWKDFDEIFRGVGRGPTNIHLVAIRITIRIQGPSL